MLNFKYSVDRKKEMFLTLRVISVKYDYASLACSAFYKYFTEHLLKLRAMILMKTGMTELRCKKYRQDFIIR